jgi:hypothetical protein
MMVMKGKLVEAHHILNSIPLRHQHMYVCGVVSSLAESVVQAAKAIDLQYFV